MRLIDADALRIRILTTTFTERNMWALKLMIGLIDDAPTVGGWISVKDRMPEDGQRVLCCLMEGPEEPRTPFYVIARKGRGRQVLGWFLGNGSVETVGDNNPNAWWMPLPEPPKEEI